PRSKAPPWSDRARSRSPPPPGAFRPAAACAWCCRWPRGGRRRKRGAARTCRPGRPAPGRPDVPGRMRVAAPSRPRAAGPHRLPVQVQALLRRLAQVVASREPAIRAGIQALREKHPHLTSDQLAMELIRSTRRRVAATGAISGAASIAPGLGTVLAIGTVTSQAFYALEQEVELVLAIAMVYGHELGGSEDRVLEALVVVGIASGALKLG